jgi:VIT1/CCC1 family predicted Fe2+/Mn2+ transporter
MIHTEHHKSTETGNNLRDFILGSQDGLVNVLGVILAVAFAVSDSKLVIIAGLAATFAESISMAAVAYTSSKAAKDFYRSELAREEREIKEIPEIERKEIRNIYKSKGFRDPLLGSIVKKITSNKKLWLRTMMEEELHLSHIEYKSPLRDAAVVGFAALFGSFIPLIPFFILDVGDAIMASLIVSVIVLFGIGYMKGKMTIKPWKSAAEMAAIGMAAALAGYAIGSVLGAAIYAA